MRSLAVIAIVAAIVLPGCAVLKGGQEVAKTIWGSSTRALEDDRGKAITKTYEKNYWEVMRALEEEITKRRYTIFKRDDVRGYMVLMGIPGSVNTTEVGVFVVELSETQTRVEFTSLSTNAKRAVSKALFRGLDVKFGLAQPDPVVDAPAGAAASDSAPATR